MNFYQVINGIFVTLLVQPLWFVTSLLNIVTQFILMFTMKGGVSKPSLRNYTDYTIELWDEFVGHLIEMKNNY